MADRVVRMRDVAHTESETAADCVVVKTIGRVGGKNVRLEVHYNAYDLCNVVNQVRRAAQSQATKWADTVASIGAPE